MRKTQVAYVSTYPPRACGIGTFTRDLARAVLMRGHTGRNFIVAVDNAGNDYSGDVKQIIDQHDRRSYESAANFLNDSDIDVVSLQHEFGIFGGDCGEYVLDLCRNIQVPVVTTFHSVLRNPPENARRIISEISQISSAVVVTIDSAVKLLEKHYGVDSDKIVVIRHGTVLPDGVRNKYAKRNLGLQKRTILATCGLISSGKGIEFAIEALGRLVEERPDLLYLVIGETHPEVLRHEGEVYRDKLISLAKRVGVEGNVVFVNRYLQEDELSLYLQAVDIYVAPYLGRDQVSSGTLTLALGHGKAIVSTPTVFAKETLSHNRGLFCRFADARSIAECIKRILNDSKLRKQLETNAFKYGQQVRWTGVADQYGDLFRSAIRDKRPFAQTATVS